ncbi:MAG: hypothetical protein JO214_14340, partial [Frankiaceae bacterium]|nr:hypothetical protein [Frankiaceae bacterium]
MSFDWMADEPDEPNSRRAAIVAAVGLLVLILVIAIFVAGPIKHLFGSGGDYSGNGTGSVTIVINPGDSATTIGN